MSDFDLDGFIKAFVNYLDKAAQNANATPEEKPLTQLAEDQAKAVFEQMTEGLADTLGAALAIVQDNLGTLLENLKKRG